MIDWTRSPSWGCSSGRLTLASFTALKKFNDLVVNAVDGRGKVRVGGLGVAVADDDIAIGEGAGIGVGHRARHRSV
jgi:hypothetical protein